MSSAYSERVSCGPGGLDPTGTVEQAYQMETELQRAECRNDKQRDEMKRNVSEAASRAFTGHYCDAREFDEVRGVGLLRGKQSKEEAVEGSHYYGAGPASLVTPLPCTWGRSCDPYDKLYENLSN